MTPEERAALCAAATLALGAKLCVESECPSFGQPRHALGCLCKREGDALIQAHNAAATPAAMLTLLAENERMWGCLTHLQNIGGLGYSVHRRIDAALEPGA